MSRNIKNFCSRWAPNRLAALGLAGALLLGGAGCARRGEEERTLRLGVALYAQDDTFIASLTQDLERLVQEAEVEREQRINLTVMDAANNQTAQMGQVDRLLERGCDVLFVNIVDRTAASVIVDKAQEAGAPLIFFNRQPVAEDINYRGRVYYVGASAEESGRLQGELVAEAWKKESGLDRNGDGVIQYVMLEGEPGHQDSLLRTEYSIKAVMEAGIEVEKLANAPANWNRGQGAARMSQWLREYGQDIEVVFSNNDDMAMGAIDAIQEWGGPIPLVVGVDATAPAREAVAAGDLYGTVLNDAQGQAKAMVDLALALMDGREPDQVVELQEDHYVWLPYRRVDRDSLEEAGQDTGRQAGRIKSGPAQSAQPQ